MCKWNGCQSRVVVILIHEFGLKKKKLQWLTTIVKYIIFYYCRVNIKFTLNLVCKCMLILYGMRQTLCTVDRKYVQANIKPNKQSTHFQCTIFNLVCFLFVLHKENVYSVCFLIPLNLPYKCCHIVLRRTTQWTLYLNCFVFTKYGFLHIYKE